MRAIPLPALGKSTHIDEFLNQIKRKSDKLVNYFMISFFLTGLFLAFFYDTWTVAVGIGGLSLIAYYSTKWALPNSNFYQYILSVVLGIFMAQYIYQMHGMFEMHFFAFIGSAMLITYQNWKLQIPITLVVVLHHGLFGYLQYTGYDNVYFTQLDYMSLQTFMIHVVLAAVIFFICALWAYHFKKYSEMHIEQSFEIGRLGEEHVQKEALKALNESLEVKVKERTAALETANSSLEKVNKDLETVNKELEAFSYSVSHDLRAPLRIINGFSNMLYKGYSDKLDARGQDYTQTIIKNATQMGDLIDDLLNFSKLGRVTPTKNPVDMTDMVKATIEEVKSASQDHRSEILLHGLNAVKCDLNLMKQVWANLISNAVKYSRKTEKPFIEIGVTETKDDAVYYIRDNGSGFDMQHADKLFGVFQRLHKITEYEGTGVGLALVHRIITKHGGKIWAEAEVDKGATFYFTLPN
ncbi:MAG: Phospho-acceptor protein [Bacteroidota bacterium]|nr:Phospho-acceptor protein [Bacteroidota bacterium]